MSVINSLIPWGHQTRALPALKKMACCSCGLVALVRDWSQRKNPPWLCERCEIDGSPL